MLTGQNGILTEAGEAKIKTEKENAREQIGREVLGSFSKYGDIDLNKLKKKLDKINVDTSGIDDIMIDDAQTGKITLNGFDFYVDNNDKVLDYSGPVGTDTPEKSTKSAFSRANGRIDIVFLNGTGYNITETPNKPALDNTMVPVYYDNTASAWIVCSENDSNWYDYHAADVSKAGVENDSENIKSKWANVMLTDNIVVQKDGASYNATQIKELLTANNLSTIVGATVTTEGSMLVWIPRYAYKITYYSEATKTNIIGYSDSRGFVYADGTYPKNMQEPTTSINVNGTIGTTAYEYYRPHPAFETDLNQGGWRTRITGIWVGKFEATGTITGTTKEVTTLSNTKALRNQTIGTLWDYIKNNFKAGTTESHMMKNSEWGAFVYLAESKFGRNEVSVTKNANSSYYTGAGNYKENQNQSTTGNIYGVYDTVGGTSEYVASYIANEKNTNGYQFASTDGTSTTKNNKTESTPYATVYKHDTSDTNTNNYALSLNKVFGDGICEISTAGSGTSSWHSASSGFAGSSSPFFQRGGNGNFAGLFYFLSGISAGGAINGGGSRVICIVK